MTYKVTNRATGTAFDVASDETVLAAAHRQSLNLPYSCQNGTCGSCKAQLIDGDIEYPNLPPNALSEQEREQGMALLCQAVPRSDITIVVREVEALKDIQPRKLPARVKSLDFLADDVARLHLGLPKGMSVPHLAGQYLDIILSDGKHRSFSIANAPSTSNLLELHIRNVAGGGFTDHVFNGLAEGDLLRVEVPLGTFFLRDKSARPMICVAGGTGFAPIKAIIEQTIINQDVRPLRFYWGARGEPDLYLGDLVQQWADQFEHLDFIPVLSEPSPQWAGRTGMVHEAVLADHADLSIFDVYMSGPPPLIEAARRDFAAHGLPVHHLYYDSFEFAPDVVAKMMHQDSAENDEANA